MCELFELFIRERRYLKNVSPATVEWYRQSWAAFSPTLETRIPDRLNKAVLIDSIEALKNRGIRSVSINTYARCMNAFLRWLHEEGHAPILWKVPRLKETSAVLSTWRTDDAERLMKYRPADLVEHRVQTVAVLILDTGARLNEVLSLRHADLDFDNLLMTIRNGKGAKQRIVPMSTYVRSALVRFLKQKESNRPEDLVFCTRDGGSLSSNNMRRDLRELCKVVPVRGVKIGFHILRHSFATNYIRSGGDVLTLQRILGHASLELTRRYVSLQTEDLKAAHSRHSMFCA